MKRQVNWQLDYQGSYRRLRGMLNEDAPDAMIRNEARVFLNSCYQGAWRTIWTLIKHELRAACYYHVGLRVEWIRTRVFRRTPDPVLEIANRVADEDLELSRMISEL